MDGSRVPARINPLVQQHPDYFMLDGTPRDEWPNEWTTGEIPVHQTIRPSRSIDARDVVACTTAFNLAAYENDKLLTPVPVSEGARLHRDDPIVQANPGCFA